MKVWKALSGEQQRAGIAAAALFLTLFLPWYRTSPLGTRTPFQHQNLTAFGVFSFVEAAVLLVSAAVLYLLYARAQRRGFHLPGGDGWAITIAGGWVVFLLVWRLFDKPAAKSGTVGVQWGIFVAMAVGAVLAATGQRMRAAHQPEPPNPAEDVDWSEPATAETRRQRTERRERRDRARAPVDSAAVTRALRDERPSWTGEPPEPPPTRRLPPDPPPVPDPPPARDASRDRTRRLREDEPTDDGEDRLYEV